MEEVVQKHSFWESAGLVPSPTCANGDCLLHSLARSAKRTSSGWKASDEEVVELRQRTADLMRKHCDDLTTFNLYHQDNFEQYCSVYGKSPAGLLPSAYWSDDCAVLCLALYLHTTVVKVEPCSDGSLLFSLFHNLQRREGVEETDVLSLLREGDAMCTFFNGSNHYTRCVSPEDNQPMPAWNMPFSTLSCPFPAGAPPTSPAASLSEEEDVDMDDMCGSQQWLPEAAEDSGG